MEVISFGARTANDEFHRTDVLLRYSRRVSIGARQILHTGPVVPGATGLRNLGVLNFFNGPSHNRGGVVLIKMEATFEETRWHHSLTGEYRVGC